MEKQDPDNGDKMDIQDNGDQKNKSLKSVYQTEAENFIDKFFAYTQLPDIKTIEYKTTYNKYDMIMKYITNKIGKTLENKKIACMFYDKDQMNYNDKIIIQPELFELASNKIDLFGIIMKQLEFWGKLMKQDFTNVSTFINRDVINNQYFKEKTGEKLLELFDNENLINNIPEKESIIKFRKFLKGRLEYFREVKFPPGMNFMSKCPFNKMVLFVSSRSHVIVLIADINTNTVELFDPSYDNQLTLGYAKIVSRDIFPGFNIVPALTIHIQAISDQAGFLDLYCRAWCLHYVHWRLNIGISMNEYQDMIIQVIKNDPKNSGIKLQHEIKSFMLNLVDPNVIFQLGGNKYYHKYIKYKSKYNKLK